MDIFIKAVQLILSLSILVILHEFGHFFFARVFKTRVEKFYLFFDPWFSLFKFKKGETEYGVGWLPLGGYVKISGMIDESMDKEAMQKPPQPWEFRAKPAYQRLLIMVAGVLVNFITALFIFWMILFKWGESYAPVDTAKYGLYYHEVGHQIGLQDGDIVLKVDTFTIETSNEIAKHILIDNGRQLTVKRGKQILTLDIPEDFDQTILANEVKDFAGIRFPIVASGIAGGSHAEDAGLMVGDSIVSVNETATVFFNEFTKFLQAHKGDSIRLNIFREGQPLTLHTQVGQNGQIGFNPGGATGFVEIRRHEYGLAEAFPKGVEMGFDILGGYIKQMKLIFTKEGVKQVGGFGAMGNLFPATWDWYTFWFNTALISLILAFMNILPIPALDGGHVLFLLYEIVTGRKPGDKFMEYAQIAGMLILLGLLLFANGNDIFKAFFK